MQTDTSAVQVFNYSFQTAVPDTLRHAPQGRGHVATLFACSQTQWAWELLWEILDRVRVVIAFVSQLMKTALMWGESDRYIYAPPVGEVSPWLVSRTPAIPDLVVREISAWSSELIAKTETFHRYLSKHQNWWMLFEVCFRSVKRSTSVIKIRALDEKEIHLRVV